MPDLQKLQNNKEKIINTIKLKGPSFPARISKETNISPLFVSAFLAELVSERRLTMTSMKVGSSPIYFMNGQENELEKFKDYLNPREKEAFFLLRQNEILEDESQTPTIRVALRKIKDFALPINVRINGKSKLFWKYYRLPNDQTKTKIQELITKKSNNLISTQPSKNQQSPIFSKENLKPQEIPEKEIPTNLNQQQEIPQQVENESIKSEPKKEIKTKEIEPIFERKQSELKQEIKKPIKSTQSPFGNKIRNYLKNKDIEIIEEYTEKKKEYLSKVCIDTKFGKQEYHLTAKDKKKISQDDLILALHNAQTKKMPSLLIAPGEMDKNAQEYIKSWKNIIKFRRLKP